MIPEKMRDLVVMALDDLKAVDVRAIDVTGATAITDYMVVASGNSDRHVRALAQSVLEAARDAGVKPLGVEGERGGEWILLDLNDVVVHLMLPRVRDFYNLEKLWNVDSGRPRGAVGGLPR